MAIEQTKSLGILLTEGDHDAFGALFSEHSDHLFRFFMIKTRGHREDSENLVQETFMKVWKSRKSFDPERDFKAWLFTVGYRTWVDSIKKQRIYDSIDELEIAAEGRTLEAEVHDRLLVREVMKALEEFPEDVREIMVMSYISDFSSEQIAEILGKKASAVRMVRMRTVEKIQNSLEGEE